MDFLRSPFDRYELEIPLALIHPEVRQRAYKLRGALRPILSLRNDLAINAADLAHRGVEAYKRELGFAISRSHWRTLFDRTIERDGGAQEWDRLEIYIEENPRRVRGRHSATAAREHGLEILEDALTSIDGATPLTVEQNRLLWTKTCDELQAQIDAGAELKRAKRDLVRVLVADGRFGRNRQAIAKTLNRKWALYLASDHKLPKDGRSLRFAAVLNGRSIPEDDFRKLVARSLDRGGRVSQAWRELHGEGKLSSETCNVSSLIRNQNRECRRSFESLSRQR